MTRYVVLALMALMPAFAEVVEKSPTGFSIKITTTLAGTPAKAYSAIVDVASWWLSSHTYSGSAKNMAIDAKAGGCFCEKLPPNGEVQHARVVFAAPGQLLRLTGGLGPLQASGSTGALTFELAPQGASETKLTLSYNVGGYMPGGIENIAQVVDSVLGDQMKALQNYLSRK